MYTYRRRLSCSCGRTWVTTWWFWLPPGSLGDKWKLNLAEDLRKARASNMSCNLHVLLVLPPYSGDPGVFKNFQYSWVLELASLQGFVSQEVWFSGLVPCLTPSGFSKKPRPCKVGLLTLSSAETGRTPMRSIDFSNTTVTSTLPGHVLVVDAPEGDSTQVQSEVRKFLEENPEYNAVLTDESQQRHSWGYTKAAPRWAFDLWFRERDVEKLSAFVLELWNSLTEGDQVLIGLATMDRMKGGELLLDCRGVKAMLNTKIHYNVDFALPASSTKVLLLTRTSPEIWATILTEHDRDVSKHGLPKVLRIIDCRGDEFAVPDARDEDLWTIASSVAGKRPVPTASWPSSRLLAVSSLKLPKMNVEEVMSWAGPSFASILGPSATVAGRPSGQFR
jgi:hypothetical protein